MNKTRENITIANLSPTEEADICFVMAIKLFNSGQEDLATKFMAKALSTR
jgi:hypothetical protein